MARHDAADRGGFGGQDSLGHSRVDYQTPSLIRQGGLAESGRPHPLAVFVVKALHTICPLTPLTERLGATHGSVSDIFLPTAVARTIPIWSSALLAIGAFLHTRAALRSRG